MACAITWVGPVEGRVHEREAEVRARQEEERLASGEWVEVFDAEKESYYYRHTVTAEVVEEAPDDYVMTSECMPLLFATIRMQSKFKVRLACRKVSERSTLFIVLLFWL